MSWFDEQLKYREKIDEENFENALVGVAEAIMGQHLAEALDDKVIANSALDEVLKYYHIKVFRDENYPDFDSVEEQFDYRLRPYGIMRRTVLLDEGFSRCAVGPMLGTMKESGEMVALIPHKFSGYLIVNPKTKEKIHINGRKGEALLDKDALCFYESLPLRKLNMMDLFKFACKQRTWSDMLTYFGLLALSTVLGMFTPMFTKNLFGPVMEYKNTTMLIGLAIYMISYSVCRVLFDAYNKLKNSRFAIKQDIAVEAAVMNRMMSLPPAFFKNYSSGELNQRANYVQSLSETLFSTVVDSSFSALFSLAYVGQIFRYAPALVIPSVIVTLVSVVFSLVVTFAQMKISEENMKLGSKTSGMTYSMISGVQKIKLAGAEKRMFARWADSYSKTAKLQYNPPVFLKISSTISSAISALGTLLIYFIAIKSKVSVSDYYAFNTAYGMVAGAFSTLAGMAVTIANIKPVLEMARPIMEAEPEVSENKEIVTSLKGAIELNNVTFRYNDDMPNVIDDLTLKIKPGEYLAVVGATGCGKSTLLRLLLGFEKPNKGSIFYDRKDTAKLDMRSVRKKIGTVLQDGKLFFGDLYSNITISAPSLTLADAWEAAEKASLKEDIEAMPMGMHTIITEGQGGISGGQRQRIMIARAIAPKPKILMFDEATSALDNITQKKISEAIDALKCTRIVIAHRLSTIRHCDRIIVLDKGRIVEDGTYEQLMELNGYFKDLVDRQRIEFQD